MVTNLYEKYKVRQYKDLPALNPLSFILRKAELGCNLTTSEWQWLEHNQLNDVIEKVKQQEDCRHKLAEILKQEFTDLCQWTLDNVQISIQVPPIDSDMALILYKMHEQEELSKFQIKNIGSSFNIYYQRFINFNKLKSKLKITENLPIDDNVNCILDKLDRQAFLTSSEIQWLYNQKYYSFLRLLKNQFTQLQNKYKAIVQDGFNGDLLLLCLILRKLDEKKPLDQSEIQYLQEYSLNDTLNIVEKIEFPKLKEKYKVTQIKEDDEVHHLYKVLKKLDAGLPLSESDINCLKKNKLCEIVKDAFRKEADALVHKIEQGQGLRPDDITWCEEFGFKEIVFKWLKKNYEVTYRNDTPESPLYTILKKLYAGNRLSEDEFVGLEAENWSYPPNKIYIAYHTLEAQFNENEFKRTKNHRNLVEASKHWRRAEKPELALKQTGNLDYKQVKPAKLRAALLTTRGGALRDIGRLNEAENCALEAIKQNSDKHYPYTLLGALCYDTGRYVEGDEWFEKAIQRGAKPKDQDAEIKRILRKKKGQEQEQELKELVDHLLKKDPHRFAWVKDFVKKTTHRNT